MFTGWDKRFDLLCGTPFRGAAAGPHADSGIKDWLYGTDPPARQYWRTSAPPVVQSGEPSSLCRDNGSKTEVSGQK
jgi:hypothetical protein